ncbi:MAG: acyl-CoA thioesterase II [Sphingobium sp.]
MDGQTSPGSTPQSPRALVDGLVDLLQLEQIEVDLFRGGRTSEPWVRVFGGQVIGQALMAACRTVEGPRLPHSLHAYFMRPGDPHLPIVYQVSRDRDGGSFSSRRVVAIQHGKPILNLSASFHGEEEGVSHQTPMPDIPPPEALENERTLIGRRIAEVSEERRRLWLRERPIEFRPVDPEDLLATRPAAPHQAYWLRAVAPLPDDQVLHRVLLAYASDMMLLSTSLLPHGLSWVRGNVQEASLDHALWIHRPFRIDDWLLYTQDSPWAGGGRGMNRGFIYARDGTLVASVAQEGLIRALRPPVG